MPTLGPAHLLGEVQLQVPVLAQRLQQLGRKHAVHHGALQGGRRVGSSTAGRQGVRCVLRTRHVGHRPTNRRWGVLG